MSDLSIYTLTARIYDLGLVLNGYKGASRWIIRQLPYDDEHDLKVLDAGAGTGLYSFAVLERFSNAEVTAFDVNAKMVEKMKQNIKRAGEERRAEAFVGDILEPILAKHGSFDLIITGGVLEYVEPRDAVKNLAPYLKSDGIFLNSPVEDNTLGRLIGRMFGFRPHSRETNIEAFTSERFELVRTLSVPHRYFPISLVKKAHIFRK